MVKLFTHTDLDGVGCAVLMQLVFGNDVDITYCNYDNINTEVNKYMIQRNKIDKCFITDISINDDLAKKINDSYENFYLLDHHPTAIELNKYKWCTVRIHNTEASIKTCGAELLYQWLIKNGYLNKNEVLDKFVDVVRNYDTWRWVELGEKGIICKQVNDLLYLYGKEEFIIWCISEIHDNKFPRLHETDKLVLRIKQKEIDDYIDEKNGKMFVSSMCGYACGFVFAEKYFSELGNRLCVMHPEIDFVAILNIDGTISYRTIKENIDLGKDVARLFGGGGHPKAAGSQFSEDIKLKVAENIFRQNR